MEASFDHSPFDSLLERHVREGMVDYRAIKATPERRQPTASAAG
jgi:hypothetical protein